MKKHISLILCIAMLLTILCGCAQKAVETTESTEAASTETQEAASAAPEAAAEAETQETQEAEVTTPDGPPQVEYTFPISDTTLEVSYYSSINPTANVTAENSEFFAKLGEMGNILWNCVLFPTATASEQFNLLAAAGDLPDVLAETNYSGSASQAVEEEIYLDIAPYIHEYAPTYEYYVQTTDKARQSLYTDEGYMVNLAMIAEEEFPPNNGVLIRKDIVQEYLDGQLPETYDEYHDYLSICRDELGMTAPLYMSDIADTVLCSGYDIRLDRFTVNDNNELVFGIITDEAKELMALVRDWFNEGLIYPEFFAIPDGEQINYLVSKYSTEESGMAYAWCEFASWIKFGDDSSAVIGPGYLPRHEKGQQLHLSEGVDSQVRESWYFSGNCSEEKLTVLLQLIDYLYTEEGALLANWGTEGETYTVQEDGSYWYTDLIINNPDGMTQNEALLNYLAYWTPHYADYTCFNIGMVTTFAEYSELWATADINHEVPSYSMTVEESDISASISTDIDTLLDETLVKFIVGDLSIENDWDSFIENLYSIGLQDYLDVNQAAYQRYISK